MNMSINPSGVKKVKASVEAGKKEAIRALLYRYNLYLNKVTMRKYIALCRMRDTTANKEIVAYIERQLKQREANVPDEL